MLIILFFILFVFNSVKSDKTEELIYKEIGSNVNETENNYLSYNLKSNNTDDLDSIEIQSLNYNKTYQQILSKISNRCISKDEFKELHGNKTKPGLVTILLPFLVDDATYKIGLNELRKGFHLKPQNKNNGEVEEEFEEEEGNKKDFVDKAIGEFVNKAIHTSILQSLTSKNETSKCPENKNFNLLDFNTNFVGN
uniref:Uncharacterized protein n=1 Tax=Meloidogyne enterolobii TaxID=390850 RepID=A0A6V7V6K8_MELEN|nr:unnamed protein product [Meloidogyne enterolobii]